MPSYLTMFRSNNPAAYDENKCLKDFNNFSKHHNEHLQGAIEELRQEFPHARILYADYYNMLMEIIVHSTSLGNYSHLNLSQDKVKHMLTLNS